MAESLVLLISTTAVAILLLDWRLERRRVHQFTKNAAPGVSDQVLITLRVAAKIHREIARREDPYYLAAMLEPLGASPAAVIDQGGCCSGLSRLLIVCLDEAGIPARQITLYHESGHAQHCLVEAFPHGRSLIVDPSYGLYYTGEQGEPIGLSDLRSGTIANHVALPETGAWGYPENDYYRFSYADTRTANWTRSRLRRGAFHLMKRLGMRIEELSVPSILEWPQLLLAALILILAATTVLGSALV